MKKLYVGKVDPKFEISKEQIEKYNLKEGTVIRYSGGAGCVVVSEDTDIFDIDIKEILKDKPNKKVEITEIIKHSNSRYGKSK